jgi:hypothetical protein
MQEKQPRFLASLLILLNRQSSLIAAGLVCLVTAGLMGRF